MKSLSGILINFSHRIYFAVMYSDLKEIYTVIFEEMFREMFMSEAATGCFYKKKGVYRNFAKFTGKHLCQSLF